ncbi:MAG TPA: sodium-translocating pyrophosphatase [Spirochaetaceae bacterium]|nr:sodium-translocating pyrophosphatase [Spirochaetaceae bacterium]
MRSAKTEYILLSGTAGSTPFRQGGNLTITIAIILASGLAATLYAVLQSRWIYRLKVDFEPLRRIAGYIADGANAFLKREYTVLAPFVLLVALFLALANRGSLKWQAAAFILGAICSAAAGFFGMRVATAANSRTAMQAKQGISAALKVAFAGGSVMGMTVAGLAMIGIAAVLALGSWLFGNSLAAYRDVVFPILSGFSLGASTIALFARVGGGIFTKAADVGADLVGKVEAGIPEDDPRNPAVIADNVGDNVGDVAGMGADLFESYVGSIIGCVVLGAGVAAADATKLKLAMLPLLICALGIGASIFGTFLVRGRPGQSPQKALNSGTFGAAILAAILLFPLSWLVLGVDTFDNGRGFLHVALAAVMGLAAGTAIGLLTEFFTGTNTAPVRKIEKACNTGAATTVISGLGVGMMSTMPPILVLAAAILVLMLANALASAMEIKLSLALLESAFYFYAAGSLIFYMMEDQRATTDELFAAGATFTLLAWAFAYLFMACQLVAPDSFVGQVNPGATRSWMDLLFLSFTTLSGVGVGDILPLKPFARALVMLEEFAGVMYFTLVVSRLIGLTILGARR